MMMMRPLLLPIAAPPLTVAAWGVEALPFMPAWLITYFVLCHYYDSESVVYIINGIVDFDSNRIH